MAEAAGECVEACDADGEDGDGDEWEEVGDESAEFAGHVHAGCDWCGEDEVEGAVFSFAGDGGGGHVDGDERDDEDFGEDDGADDELEVGGVDLLGVVEDGEDSTEDESSDDERPAGEDAPECCVACGGFAPCDWV